MIRRTITLPDDLAAEIDAQIDAGTAKNVSRFIHDAVRAHLEHLRAEHLAREVGRLDPAEEIALATGSAAPVAPWHRLETGPDSGAG